MLHETCLNVSLTRHDMVRVLQAVMLGNACAVTAT